MVVRANPAVNQARAIYFRIEVMLCLSDAVVTYWRQSIVVGYWTAVLTVCRKLKQKICQFWSTKVVILSHEIRHYRVIKGINKLTTYGSQIILLLCRIKKCYILQNLLLNKETSLSPPVNWDNHIRTQSY